MYTTSWLIMGVLIMLGAIAFVSYVLVQRKRGRRHFDVDHGNETGYKGPPAQPSSYF